MADPVWPYQLLRPADNRWNLVGAAVTGGRPVSGDVPLATTFSGGPMWEAELSGVALRTAEQVNEWHGLEALLAGGTRRIILPRCDLRHGPVPSVEGVAHDADVPYDGGVYYDGLQPFTATIAQAAPVRATMIRIARSGGRPLTRGMHFSINHGGRVSWRLYRIADFGTGNQVEIRPPLRAAVAEGVTTDFKLPRCVMRLAEADGMKAMLQQNRRAQPSVVFREAGFDDA